jgi:hypothetical protein
MTTFPQLPESLRFFKDLVRKRMLRTDSGQLYSNREVIRSELVFQRHEHVLRRSVDPCQGRAFAWQARAGAVRTTLLQRRSGDGMALTGLNEESRINPLDVVERIASVNDWSFERAGDDEITILIAGRWSDYQVSFTWMNDIEALHLACAFDLKVPERRRSEVQQLISLINEQLWVGHFDLWIKDGMVMFRHALVLSGGLEPSNQQCQSLLSAALEACEGYFPAFQFVVWAGKEARAALDAAMFETSGEA